jgi:hypothetical protein
MTDITTPENSLVKYPKCAICAKEIWGIVDIRYTIGTERPKVLHAVCFEELYENEGMDK